MQEILHLSSSTATPPLPTPTQNPKFSSAIPSSHLHFPPPNPCKSPSISFSSTSKPHQQPSPAPAPPPSSPPPSPPTLQEKLLFLDSLGIDSIHCLDTHPPLISTPLSDIKAIIDYLHSLGLSTQDLRRIFRMCPDILAIPLASTLRPAVTFLLREAHVEGKELPRVIRRRPRLLTRSVDRQLRPTLYFLQSTIGIEDVTKCTQLLSCSVEVKFIPRLEYLQKLGFSKKESIMMFRRFPSLFCYSIEDNFEPKFNYFVVEMGRELKELISFPHYFSFSLENRIKPRHRMCVEKGVCLSLPLMLKSSEKQFRERLEVCYNSSIPVRTSPLWCTKFDDNNDRT